ncbi:hypothetical protein LVJ82_17020 [Vitreoscilla massiliensis]|uniref:Uncharacterized protein n=1 Tax=Vitreoscilla massiliensis TaxID=1689272 RepID=A0ABY4E1A8_9NEIS|nr:hypothetical protein [Vitreoscilla massiliensis]UOO89121.1 hypothetical protein LVJ82_17020 [Vitreoscilla massiliensis]
MKFRNQWMKYGFRNESGSDGGDSGSGGQGNAKTYTEEELQAAIEAQTSGLKSKRDELLNAQKQLKEQLKQFDGIDPEATRNMLKRFENDEEAKLIAAGNVDEVVNRRVDRMQSDFDKNLKIAQAETQKYQQKAQNLEQTVINGHVAQAAAAAGVLPNAIDDIAALSKGMFALNDQGQALLIGADGQPQYAADGKTPMTAHDWVSNMKETKPYFFPSAQGGGARGSDGASGGSLKRSQMSAEQVHEYTQKHGRAAYLALPK